MKMLEWVVKASGHTKNILTHKYWVARYCFKLGLYWQGVTHDLSKFHPTEFLESVRYYVGTSSPINECKKANGYSDAWFHHRGNNKHHYEMWVDNFDNGGKMLVIPYKYVCEMLCDYLGAARTYYGREGGVFTYKKEYEWWRTTKMKNSAMHSVVKNFLDEVLRELMECEGEGKDTDLVMNNEHLERIYDKHLKNCGGDEYIRDLFA